MAGELREGQCESETPGAAVVGGFMLRNPTRFSQGRAKKNHLVPVAEGGERNHFRMPPSILHNKGFFSRAKGFPGASSGLKIPWRREWQQRSPVSLPGKSQGQRSLVGYSTRSLTESDTTERLTLSLFYFHSWLTLKSSLFSGKFVGKSQN